MFGGGKGEFWGDVVSMFIPSSEPLQSQLVKCFSHTWINFSFSFHFFHFVHFIYWSFLKFCFGSCWRLRQRPYNPHRVTVPFVFEFKWQIHRLSWFMIQDGGDVFAFWDRWEDVFLGTLWTFRETRPQRRSTLWYFFYLFLQCRYLYIGRLFWLKCDFFTQDHR